MLHFAMFVLRCFPNHLGWFAIDPVLSIDYIEELMKVCGFQYESDKSLSKQFF